MTQISKASQIAALANDIVSVKDFGAVCDGVTDDTAAVQAAMDSGNTRIVFPSTCAISSGIQVYTAGLGIIGAGWDTPSLKKMEGFPDEPALTIGNGVDGQAYNSLEDFYINGSNQAGDGLVLQKLGNFTSRNVRVYANKGWGLHRDGLWLSSMENAHFLNNGVDGVSGGGILDTFIIRETSDLTCVNVNSNSNENHQMLWDEAQSATARMVAFNQYGGAYETIDKNPTSPVCEFRCGDRSVLFGVRFNASVNNTSNSLSIGSSTGINNVKDLSFIACYTQGNVVGSDIPSVNITGEIESVFFERHEHRGTEKFLDTTSMTSGLVWVTGSPTIGSEVCIDPDKRIRGSNLQDSIIGRRYGSTGNEFLVKSYEDGVPLWLQYNTINSELKSLKLGVGASEDHVLFDGCNPRLKDVQTGEPEGINGVIAFTTASTDQGNGFGASGAGFYGYVQGSWVKF